MKEVPSESAVFLGVNPPDCLEILFGVAVCYFEGSSSLLCSIPRKLVIFPSQMHLTIKVNKSIMLRKN